LKNNMEVERLSVPTDHVCSSSNSSEVEWWVHLKVCVLEFSCSWIIISDWMSVTKIYSIVECTARILPENEPGRVSQNFQTGSKTGRMTSTQHVP
jgi:hypothetical protein